MDTTNECKSCLESVSLCDTCMQKLERDMRRDDIDRNRGIGSYPVSFCRREHNDSCDCTLPCAPHIFSPCELDFEDSSDVVDLDFIEIYASPGSLLPPQLDFLNDICTNLVLKKHITELTRDERRRYHVLKCRTEKFFELRCLLDPMDTNEIRTFYQQSRSAIAKPFATMCYSDGVIVNILEMIQLARRIERMDLPSVRLLVTGARPRAESGVDEVNATQTQENVVFTDQRETVVEEGYLAGQEKSTMTTATMPQNLWTVSDVMRKPVPIWTGDWTTTSAGFLKQFKVPGDTLFGPHYNQLATFTFFRGHPKIRIQVNGTKFHCGRLIAAFVPYQDIPVPLGNIFNTGALLSLPHVILDASIANSGELELPFVHMNTYFNTTRPRPWQYLGDFYLLVFNGLRAASGASQSIGVTVWTSFENCELHQPVWAHDVALPKSATARAESLVEGLVKSLTTGIAQSATSLITDLAAPVMDVFGGSSNLDKPTDPMEIARWVPNAVTGLSFGDGLDRSSRLSLKPGTITIPSSDIISTTKDDMNLLELCKIPTRLLLTTWTDSQDNGQRIQTFDVTPSEVISITDSGTTIEPTLLAYVSRGFKFWRGSLRYKIQVVASQMHTGRLLITYGAGIPQNDSIATFNNMSYTNVMVIDLQERHEVEFDVPFLCERTYLRSDKFEGVGVTQAGDENFRQVGIVGIFVLNRLSRPDSVSAAVDVNVLISAGDDFELCVPCDLSDIRGIYNTPLALAESQSTVTTRTDADPIMLGHGVGRITQDAAYTMSENAMDLKTLVRRYVMVRTWKNQTMDTTLNGLPTGMFYTFPNTPHLGTTMKGGYKKHLYASLLAYYSRLFAFWRGSLRYKVVVSRMGNGTGTNLAQPPSTFRLTAFHSPGTWLDETGENGTPSTCAHSGLFGNLTNLGSVIFESGVQSSLEFEIPYYTPYPQLVTVQGNSPHGVAYTGAIFLCFEMVNPVRLNINPPQENPPVTFAFDVFQSAGDDFVLNYLKAAPILKIWDNSEARRITNDSTTGLVYTTIPNVCATTFSDVPIAEGLRSIPGFSQIGRSLEAVERAGNSIGTVCDTAQHLLQQASTRTGLTDKDEDDDEKFVLATEQTEDVKARQSTHGILDSVMATLQNLIGTVSEGAKSHINIAVLVTDVAAIVSGLTAYNQDSWVIKVSGIVTILNTILRDVKVVLKESLFSFVSSILETIYGCLKGNVQPSAEAVNFDLIAPLTATFCSLVGVLGFSAVPNAGQAKEMCKELSEKLRLFNFASLAVSNLKSMWAFITEAMQWIVEYVMKILSPTFLAGLKMQREFSDIEEWAAFIDSLASIDFTDRIHYDLEFKNKLFRCVDQGKRYNGYLLTGKVGRSGAVVREYVRKIIEIAEKCEGSKNELPFRRDPFCICLTGATNLGKSGCVTSLAFDIMDQMGYPQHNRWCSVNVNEKFFTENYRQQTAVYFDDFGALDNEEQYKTFFNLKANTAYPLDMAFRKGEYFNSDFVFMTTNTPYPRPNFITNVPAFLRRRNILVECSWVEHPEIRAALNNRADMGPYRQLDHSHVRFRLLHPGESSAPAGEWMTFAQLVEHCTICAYTHLNQQQDKMVHDLVRAGYILPQAQGAESRVLQTELLERHPIFKMHDVSLLAEAVWDIDQQVFIPLLKDAYESEVWESVIEDFGQGGPPLQHALRLCSSLVGIGQQSALEKVKMKLKGLWEDIQRRYLSLLETYPWLGLVGHWTAAFVGGFAVTWLSQTLVVGTLACACKMAQNFGYRCVLCGTWPDLKNLVDAQKNFILGCWRSIYGKTKYREGAITTIQEENAFKTAASGVNHGLQKAQLGTMAEALGPYSVETKGIASRQVIANSTPEVVTPSIVQAVAQSNTQVLVESRILKYMYRLHFEGNERVPPNGISCFALGDRYVLVNTHFFLNMRDGDIFKVFHSGAWLPVEYLTANAKPLEKKDLVVYEMPIQFHAHRDNTKHFISEADLPFFRTGKAVLCKLTAGCQHVLVDDLDVQAQEELHFEAVQGLVKFPLYVQKAWKYRQCSKMGDCGSPLVAYSDRISGKILGFHCASDGSSSFAQLVTREMIAEVVKRKDGTPLPTAEAKFGNLIPPGHFGRIGKVASGRSFYQSPKTEIIPTRIHGRISKPVSFPSVLSKSDPRLLMRIEPLRLGISKYGACAKPFPTFDRVLVNNYFFDEVRGFKPDRTPKVLTLEESCAGIPEIEGFERLPMNTSPGYPWILQRKPGDIGKEFLFDEGKPGVALREAFERRDDRARRGERVESVWVDCLKDERRPLAKIQKGSTRVFTIPPVDFSLMMRKYTLDYSATIKKHRRVSSCKVGIDPQSLEWTEMFYWLAGFSDKCIAGDFQSFDGTMHGEIMDDVRREIDVFYEAHGKTSEADVTARKILFDELVHTIQLARDELYMTHKGNKSGNPLTTILNSRVHIRYLALAWLGLARKFGKNDMRSMGAFAHNVLAAVYGDDDLIAVKPEVLTWFNQETISEYFDEYGIVYTNEEKTGVTAFKELGSCSFLKQSFGDHERISFLKVPLMKESTILELLNWTRKSPDQDQLLKDNCTDALRFAYFYGESYFDSLRSKIIAALTEEEVCWRPMLFDDYHQWFLAVAGLM